MTSFFYAIFIDIIVVFFCNLYIFYGLEIRKRDKPTRIFMKKE